LIVAFDASVLVYLFDAEVGAPVDPATSQPVTRCGDRIAYLIAELQRSKAKIIVPAPALAEVLVYAGPAAPEWLRILSTTKHVRVAPFDELAAVEFAALEQERLTSGRRSSAPRRKVKFDEQIVSIARVEGADVLYSDDEDIRKLSGATMDVRGIADLDLPPQQAQFPLEFQPVADEHGSEAGEG
jgi:predicted nucleic acid-binding protein